MGTQSHWKPLYTEVPGTLTQGQACPWQSLTTDALAELLASTKAHTKAAVVSSKAWQHSSVWAVAPLPTPMGHRAILVPALLPGEAQQSQLSLLSLLSFQGIPALLGSWHSRPMTSAIEH